MGFFIVLIGMPVLQRLTAYLFQLCLPGATSLAATYCRIFLQQIIGIYLPVLCCFRRKPYFPKNEFKIEKPGYLLRCIWLGFLLQFVGISANLPITVFLQQLGFSAPSSLPNANNFITLILQVVVVCLIPAIFEEVLFRRMVFGDLCKQSPRAAILFSAVFFAMAHFDFHNFAATLVIGICLGILRHRCAPLILCVITHFFVNFTALILNFILKIPTAAALFDRYYLLIALLAIVLLSISFPKKLSSVSPFDQTEQAENERNPVLLQPLFWLYLAIFFLLGVRNL